jgi:seryl-tRNA synthetase
MLDIKYIVENSEKVKKMVRDRQYLESVYLVDEAIDFYKRRNSLIKETESLRQKRNFIAKQIGRKKANNEDTSSLELEAKDINRRIKSLEDELIRIEEELKKRLLNIPNILMDDVPYGIDENDNKVVYEWGEKPKFDFEPKPHWELLENVGIDIARGVKLAGTRFYVYKGLAARLERALGNFMLDLHTKEHNYLEVFPPYIVKDECMYNTGQYPKFLDEYYRIERDGLSLIPTAEVPLTNLYADEILSVSELPIKLVALTSCFRREAGASGKDTKGIIRVHQFQKVELVKFVLPEKSEEEHKKLLDDVMEVLRRLNLHFRVVLLCSGDTGFTSAKTYDVEVWLPGAKRYLEISSCSNFLDFQARRGKIRFKRDKKAKPELVHTLNASGLAIGRTLAAIIENYQTKDGNIIIPEVLKSYL